MRTYDLVVGAVLFGFGLACGPAMGFDGTRTPSGKVTPFEAFQSASEALKIGETAKAVDSLQYAAENGHPLAQWQLGRMYAKGEGVGKDDLRAFQYFVRIVNAHADDSPGTRHAPVVANAFVALGHYYRDGIPNSAVRPDPVRAQEMFSYAASYFGDRDAQYYLARLYFDGKGTARDRRQAARWFRLAAQKGQHQAQAMFGAMLFKGDQVPRDAAAGLMWLTLARDSAGPDDAWITELYDAAFKQATADEQAKAFVRLGRWMSGQRE
jgi:TPR repeat protein